MVAKTRAGRALDALSARREKARMPECLAVKTDRSNAFHWRIGRPRPRLIITSGWRPSKSGVHTCGPKESCETQTLGGPDLPSAGNRMTPDQQALLGCGRPKDEVGDTVTDDVIIWLDEAYVLITLRPRMAALNHHAKCRPPERESGCSGLATSKHGKWVRGRPFSTARHET